MTPHTPAAPAVAVIGEALVDIVAGVAHPGGSPMNVAVGLARLGEPAILHTLVGADSHGDLIRAHLAAAGVTLGAGSVGATRTWSARATLDANGSAAYEFDLDGRIPVPPLEGLRLVHTGSIGALRDAEAADVREAFAAASLGTMLSFDPNIRAAVMGEQARERTFALAASCHVVKLSDEDAHWLRPGVPLEDVLSELAGAGVRFGVITRGAQGCIARVDDEVHRRAARTTTVSDTIGAGDAFMSGLLFGLLREDTDRALVTDVPLTLDAVVTALDCALASAAITVSRTGANPPTAAELAAALAVGG
ncbi:PfkB family carbohydrate kinase [Microbacterium nymphoidis]|uniref:PfkB family carbohydrate kinase n=1 Tax=Microbacterium nymphoidis TaxID=2898586 RepID=UPI001E59839A|nr:PfkB family carbohydrate kinase [Microbacterium nymphoidis]MCD2499047.1 PfkB family carbohydrate kinase [Microbacterium nymphoidis]